MSLTIVFAGTPEFAAASLDAICRAGYKISAVYTQPDRPAGRGKRILKSAVKQSAEEHNLPVFQPESLKNEEAQAELAALEPDLMIVAAYGLILPQSVLDIPKLGCINIHASLLPHWRGAAPIQRAIQAGDAETGITIMQMDAGLDTGDMLLKKTVPIASQDTGGSLHDKLMQLGAEAILEYLENPSQFSEQAEKQNDELASYAHKLTKQEAQIDWNEAADSIARKVRAFNPWPVSYFLANEDRIRVLSAEAEFSESPAVRGEVISKDKSGILIKCGSGALRILSLQIPGSKAQSALDFHNGGKTLLNAGTSLL